MITMGEQLGVLSSAGRKKREFINATGILLKASKFSKDQKPSGDRKM